LDELQPDSPYTPHRDLIQFVADRPGHDRRYDMNTERIERELGWQPQQSLNTGLLHTVKWYLDHPDWVEVIRQQQDYQGWLDRNYTLRENKA
jgi:dTDP-glucose 4,6-dehydratase